MVDDDLRTALCQAGRSLFERGYVHGSAGNISCRLDDGSFLITPSDACLGRLDPDRLARVNAEGVQLSGDRASKTLALHRRIYAAAPQSRWVIHTHSTHLVALTLQGVWHEDDILPPLTPYQLMKVGHVPLIRYHRPGDPAVADVLESKLRAAPRPFNAVMVERLGPNVWHQTLDQAMALLEELEETARLWLLSDRQATPLTDTQINELRAQFNAPW